MVTRRSSASLGAGAGRRSPGPTCRFWLTDQG